MTAIPMALDEWLKSRKKENCAILSVWNMEIKNPGTNTVTPTKNKNYYKVKQETGQGMPELTPVETAGCGAMKQKSP